MRPTASLAAVAALILAAPATAQEAAPDAGAAASEPSVPGAFGAAAAMDAADLRQIAGREDVGAISARADQRNVVTNNSVTGNSVTGSVSIDGNAFQNLQGLAVISANSGNNVAMNAAMNVTITMAPPR